MIVTESVVALCQNLCIGVRHPLMGIALNEFDWMNHICLCYIFTARTYVCVTYSLREPYVCVTYSLQFFHPYCILICHHSFSECCFSTACIYALSTLMDDRLCCSLILAKLAHFLPVAFPLSITSGHLQLSSTFHLQSSKQSLYQ